MPYDLLIKNARIVDGSGASPTYGAIAIQSGRIMGLGKVEGQAREIINADGLVVCPGFIDLHTHYDAQITWDPHCTPSCYHGTTTVMMSNCGYSMAPVAPRDRDYVMGTFSCVEGVSKHTLVNGMPWEWETLPEYITWLRKRGLGINAAVQVGHSAVRRSVLGEEAHLREATASEVSTMAQLVRIGLDAGAVGFTTSRVAHQKGEFGEPIPSYVAAEQELFDLANVLREKGRGIIGINPRTKALDFKQEDRDQLVQLAKTTGRVVNWNEFNQRPEWPGQWRSLLDFMEGAQQQGAQVYAVMRCQPMNVHFNLMGSQRFNSSILWREFGTLPYEEKLNRLKNDTSREALALALRDSPSEGRLRFERLGVGVASREENHHMNGRLLADIASDNGADPAKLFVDLALREGLRTEFALLGVSNDDDRAVEEMLKSPATITGISDAGAHLHSLCGVDYPTYFLRRWVVEKEAFSLEEGIRSLTSVPAALAGLGNRGLIRTGAAADLCIFDPETIAPAPLEIWHDLPGGESRHVKRAQGIHSVIVNGQRILNSGELTGALPGQLLTGDD